MELTQAISVCAPAIAQSTMRAVVMHESGAKPHAIGYKIVNKDGSVMTLTTQPQNALEAKTWADWLIKNGYKFDAGFAQINSINFERLGLNADNVFDVCTNLRASAVILGECFARASGKMADTQDALHAALSCYQSGNFRTGFRTGYVHSVTKLAMRFENEAQTKKIAVTK